MSYTKKRVLAIMVVLAMMVCLVACGNKNSKSDAAGVYNLTKLDMGGVSMDLGQLGEQAGVDVKVTMELKEDGNFTLDMGTLGLGESMSGTWKANGSVLILTVDGEDATATLDGKVLTLKQDDQAMIFEKAE